MGTRTTELTHDRLWAAIDSVAEHNGLSPSALARRAGLSSTAFNKSKRVTSDGRPRWPSTESLAKILEATGADLLDFVRLIAGTEAEPLGPIGDAPFLPPPPSTTIGFSEASATDRGGHTVAQGEAAEARRHWLAQRIRATHTTSALGRRERRWRPPGVANSWLR